MTDVRSTSVFYVHILKNKSRHYHNLLVTLLKLKFNTKCRTFIILFVSSVSSFISAVHDTRGQEAELTELTAVD